MARKISVEILGDSRNLERSFKNAADSSHRLVIGLGQLIKGVVIIDAVQKAIEGLTGAMHLGVEEFKEASTVQAQTVAALKSTGGIANVTSKHIGDMAMSLSNLSGIDDEVVKASENVLLSFTNIRNFAGKNNQIFDEATKAVTDYAARTGRDLPNAALIIGRALEDPARRATSLSRAGIVLSGAQLKALQAIEKTQGILAAQKVLIKDLEDRFKGAAEAAGKTLPGQLNILRDRFKDLAGAVVGTVVPAFTKGVVALTGFVRHVSEAQGIHAKLSVVWEGISQAGKDAQSALQRAIAKVDWHQVFAKAQGIADGFQARLEQINWGKVGATIGDGIAKGIAAAKGVVPKLAQRFDDAFKAIDWTKLGKAAGPGLAAAVVTAFATLLDPSFWVKNWDLALAVASVAFGGVIGKVAGKLAAPLARLGGKFAGDIALAVAGAVERVAPKLAEPVLAALQRLPGLATGLLERLVAPVRAIFDRLGRLTQFVVKVLGVQAAINAITGFAGKVAQFFAKPIKVAFALSGLAPMIATVKATFGAVRNIITGNFDAAWKSVKRGAIQAAIDLVEPFTHIPNIPKTGIGGGPFRRIKASLEHSLADLAKSAAPTAQATGAVIGTAITTGLVNGVDQSETAAKVSAALARQTAASTAPANLPPAPGPPLPAERKGITASQRNTFFDNALTRMLDRVQDIPTLQGQLTRLKQIAGIITARIAVTKDITRKLTLEDGLVNVIRQEKGIGQQISQGLLDALQLNVDKAGLTKSLQDDLSSLDALRAGIAKQIKAGGDVLALEQQLVSVEGQIAQTREQIAANRAAARNARQFRALGLTATGEDVIPGVKSLRKQLGTIDTAIAGTFLDTKKTRSLMSHLREVLSGGLGAVGRVVRDKVEQILKGLEDQLKSHQGDVTKFSHISTAKLLSGLGLDPAQIRALRPRLAALGPGGVVPHRQHAFALAGGGTVIHIENLHSAAPDYRALENELQRRARSRPQIRRGAR